MVQWLSKQLDSDAYQCELWHHYECQLLALTQDGEAAGSAQAALEMFGKVPGAVCTCGVPAQVLRDIEAKRRLIADYQKEARVMDQGHRTGWTEGGQAVREHLIKAWAAVYDQRDGYQEAWRP